MPRLADHECFRFIGLFDIAPVLSSLDRMQFVYVNQGGTDTNRYPCDLVLQNKFTPELNALVSALPLGGRTARAVLRRLDPRQNIPPHVDAWMPSEADWRRFQLPLVTHWSVMMRWPDDGVGAHLEAGKLYEVRYDRTHEVVNGADIARIHLQVDQIDATI